MDLEFLRYTIDDAGVTMEFVCYEPGPGRPTNYAITITDSELAATTTTVALRALVKGKLGRKLLAAGVASKLDGFVGQTVTI